MDLIGGSCCGLDEVDSLAGYRTAKDALKAILCYDWGVPHVAHLLFAQVGRSTCGTRLAALVKREGLGTVVRSQEGRMNGKVYVAFLWTLDRRKLETWGRRNNVWDGEDPRGEEDW